MNEWDRIFTFRGKKYILRWKWWHMLIPAVLMTPVIICLAWISAGIASAYIIN